MFGLKTMPLFGGGGRSRWRQVVGELVETQKLAPRDYARALAEGPGPASWAFALFVFFGAAQIVAALVYFFAYNWRDLSDMAKLALPQAAMAIGLVGWLAAPAGSVVSRVSAVLAAVMIGVSMGVVGQVYQLGADPWRLFATWAAFAFLLSILARSDALYAIFAAIAATAWGLFAHEELTPFMTEFRFEIPAVIAGGLTVLLAARELAGGAPRWLRWLFGAAALLTITPAAVAEAVAGGDGWFEDGLVATAALGVIAAFFLAVYSGFTADRPVRAMSLFAVAVWVGALGIRTIWRGGYDEPAGVAFALFITAGWVVGVTAALAVVLRRLAGQPEARA